MARELRMKTFSIAFRFWIDLRSAFVPFTATFAFYGTNRAYGSMTIPSRYVLSYDPTTVLIDFSPGTTFGFRTTGLLLFFGVLGFLNPGTNLVLPVCTPSFRLL